MKTLLVTPKAVSQFIGISENKINKIHSYVRPDGLNAVSEPIKKTKVRPQISKQYVYFKPTECVMNVPKTSGVGEKLDFKLG